MSLDDPGPSSPPCPTCHREAMERHTLECPTFLAKRRPYVPLAPRARRWYFRDQACAVRGRGRSGVYRCGRRATLWWVGPRGGVLGRWCAQHEGNGVRTYLRDPRGELRDAGYTLRSTEEELAMWAIGNGPDVKPWYGPASRASTGG